MLEKMKGGGDTIDIYGDVSMLCTQRNYMVQTEDQYFFIHEAVAEAIMCGNTECPWRSCPPKSTSPARSFLRMSKTPLTLSCSSSDWLWRRRSPISLLVPTKTVTRTRTDTSMSYHMRPTEHVWSTCRE